jgi:hypothetical protein
MRPPLRVQPLCDQVQPGRRIRQVEDLERKFRLSEAHGSNVINLKRK